uniref:NADH-ubiquinone oxidoreductase chain 6 n=1 Tax=Pentatoma semiannulata TaxID=286669 RepID=A0A7M3UZS0_9HEMI|nr:NADH dehydrogenase subunit 6 [Pentatoma semiannulata]QOL12473.1 NADH dehydrogenase subunit 6 [Pentatoma semiannulata]
MLLSFMIMLSLSLLWLNHPLSMGLILIIKTMITAAIVGYMMKSFFFSYIIIIIMLSGALVLFIYMASIASNEKFNLSVKMVLSMITTLALSMLMTMLIISNNYFNFEMKMNESISLIKIFNMMSAKLTMMMIIYLLLTMIVVSNIAKVIEGPLRMKN